MNVLVLCPMKPNLHPELKKQQLANLKRLPGANNALTFTIVVDERGTGDKNIKTLEERVNHTAPIRQALIDEHLKDDTDFVMWIDADVIKYNPSIITLLVMRSMAMTNKGCNVVAPLVLLDGCRDRFYDIAGFVEHGKWCQLYPPYFKQKTTGIAIALDGVGCFYLVPAEVYRKGGKHVNRQGFTDHLAICEKAREMGLGVLCFTDLVVYHADLVKFGENYH